MIDFAYPWVLFGGVPVALLGIYFIRWRREPSVVVATAAPFRAARRRRRLGWPDWLYLLGALLLVIALARPRYGDEKVVVRAQGIDIIIALDMSGSMQAVDLPRRIATREQLAEALEKGTLKHRLEVAKAEIRRFIMQRPNDRIGLIGFADQAYSFAPPTLDHAWLVDRLDQLEPGMIGDATGIAAPIGSATSRLKNSAAPRRVLVLFTDGANTAENRVTPEQAARLAKEFNVIIHTVGIGSNQAFVIGTGFGGGLVPVRDSFDEPLLRRLAETTGGSYFRAADADGMRQVMDEINRLERTNIEQPRYVEYREYAPLLALAALAVLLAGFTLQCTWKLRLP